MYNLNVFRFLLSIDDSLLRMKEAEKINHIWKTSSLLICMSMIIYGSMAYFGIGSNVILSSGLRFTPDEYESSKFWFIIGRTLYGAIYAGSVIIVPAMIFKWLTNI